jgi:hypothetical protein
MSIMYIYKLVCIYERERRREGGRGKRKKMEEDDIYEHIRNRVHIFIYIYTNITNSLSVSAFGNQFLDFSSVTFLCCYQKKYAIEMLITLLFFVFLYTL